MNEVIKQKTISVIWRMWSSGSTHDPYGRNHEESVIEHFSTKKEAIAFIKKLKVNANPSRIELVETNKKTTVFKQ